MFGLFVAEKESKGEDWTDAIDALIEINGEEYVKEIFAEKYADYVQYKQEEEEEESEEESEEEVIKSFIDKYGEKQTIGRDPQILKK